VGSDGTTLAVDGNGQGYELSRGSTITRPSAIFTHPLRAIRAERRDRMVAVSDLGLEVWDGSRWTKEGPDLGPRPDFVSLAIDATTMAYASGATVLIRDERTQVWASVPPNLRSLSILGLTTLGQGHLMMVAMGGYEWAFDGMSWCDAHSSTNMDIAAVGLAPDQHTAIASTWSNNNQRPAFLVWITLP
jgi:hypothetical protein